MYGQNDNLVPDFSLAIDENRGIFYKIKKIWRFANGLIRRFQLSF